MSEAASGQAARRPGEPEEAPGQRALCVLFRRGEDRFAIRADEIHKVTEPGWINRLPRLPPAALGITQHRGRIVTVVDLAELFESAQAGEREVGTAAARVLILERGQRHIGVWVDAVERIANIRFPEGAGGVALVSHGGEALSVLDAEALLRRVLALGGAEEG